ncbi:MAG: LptA/OstA family protein [bacterium]|nr:LptA/OstA family protein [bacterium]
MKAWLCLICLLLPLPAVAQSKASLVGIQMLVDKEKGHMTVIGEVVVRQEAREMVLTADRLELERDTISDEITFAKASGSVVVHQKDGFAQFDQGQFDRNLNLVLAEGNLVLGDQQTRVTGHRARYDLDRKTAQVTPLPGAQVHFELQKKSQLNPGEYSQVKGQASEILLFEAVRKAVLQGAVALRDEEEMADLSAQRLVLFLDQNDELEEITASGGFRMAQPGRKSKSDRAVLDYRKRIVTLLGNAEVSQVDEGRVEGDRIEMYMDVDKGLVQGKHRQPVRIEIPLN